MDTRDLIARVAGMEVFLPVFEELRLADSESAGAIETALRGCVAETHAGLTD